MVSWIECEAQVEAGFRRQNEWIDGASKSFAAGNRTETFVCECGDRDCVQTVELTPAEYELVRSSATRFLIVPNHENPESEVVLSESAGFAVIEQVASVSLRIARATDPRSDRTEVQR